MNNLPWYGWALLGFLLLTVLAVNIWLILAARHKKGISALKIPEKDPSRPKPSNVIGRLVDGIRDPWKKEDEMLAELARRTNELRKTSQISNESHEQSDKPG